MSKLFEYIDTLNTPYEAFISRDNYSVRPHWHYYMEIMIMFHGHVEVDCDKYTRTVSPGDVFVFCPRQVHSVSKRPEDEVEYGILKFDIGRLNVPGSSTPSLRQIFEGAQNTMNGPLHFLASELPRHLMFELFENCRREIDKPDFGYDLVLHSSLVMMLTKLIRIMRSKGLNTDAAVSGSSGYVTVDTISEYIDQHSSEHLSATDLADMCGMSYSYFAKSFKQIYGRSCKEYLEFVRVSKAEDLLLFTDFDLTYISLETGFSDCSHLIKVFKKWKGVTPKQYRVKKKTK